MIAVRRVLTPWTRALLGAVFLCTGTLQALAQTGVLFEVVNDSAEADTNVFIKVPGYFWSASKTNTVSQADLFVNLDTNQVSASYTSIPLTSLETAGTLVSTVTGRTNRVYTFRAYDVKSGQIVVSYGRPFDFAGGKTPNPAPNQVGSDLRFEYAEFSIEDGTNDVYNAVDLTYVDKFGIPLQLEWFRGASSAGALVNASYTYVSTKTLVDRFRSLGLQNAVFSLDGTNMTPGWRYTGPDSFGQFARIIGPSKINGGIGDSVAPYPDASHILNAAAATSGFTLNGDAPQGGYNYLGYTVTVVTNASGWELNLVYTPALVPAYSAAVLNGAPYTNTLTVDFPQSQANYLLFGAPVGPTFYRINGAGVPDSTSATYPVETWMIGDVLSALNFGFVGGRYGTNSADWYSKLDWTHFPFGSARGTNDGLYNPYSALLYNATDGYGFAFSERITPSVLLNPLTGDTVRMTILPDVMLDAPNPVVGAVTSNSIALQWKPVAGATGYEIRVVRPDGIAPVTTTDTSVVLTNGIGAGQPYFFTVQAVGVAANGNRLVTPARPIQVITPGSPSDAAGSIPVVVSFNTSDPFASIQSVAIGKQSLSSGGGGSVPLSLSPGDNWIPVQVMGVSGGSTNRFYFDYLRLQAADRGEVTVTNSTPGFWYSFYGPNPASPSTYYWQFSTDPTAYTNPAWFTDPAEVQRFTNAYPAGLTSVVPLLELQPRMYGQDTAHLDPVVAFSAGVNFPVTATNQTSVNGTTQTWANQFAVTVPVEYPPLPAFTYPNIGLVVGITYSPTSSHQYARVRRPESSATTYDGWMTGYPLSGADQLPDSDPDQDGADNLTEYAQGRDPVVPDAAGAIEWVSSSLPGEAPLIARIRWNPDALGVVDDVTRSGDLRHWTSDGIEGPESFQSADGEVDYQDYRIPKVGDAVFVRARARDPQ